jgi:hypothetical protein
MKPFPPHWGQFGLAPPQWQGRRGEWSGLSAISLSGCLPHRVSLAGSVVSRRMKTAVRGHATKNAGI